MPHIADRHRTAELLAAGAPVIDVLPAREHEELHIEGSTGIWLRRLDAESVAPFSKTDPIVVYCHDYI